MGIGGRGAGSADVGAPAAHCVLFVLLPATFFYCRRAAGIHCVNLPTDRMFLERTRRGVKHVERPS